MTTQSSKRTKVFISYSHQDAEWLRRLRVHLKPLERDHRIDIWDDTRIRPGSKWREEIRQALTATKVAVLLVSADFLASDFIATDELPPLLSAAEDEGAVILPVILSPSRFLKTPSLAQFQAVNNPSRPLIGMTKDEQEAVLVNVSEAIEASLTYSPEVVTKQPSTVEVTGHKAISGPTKETDATVGTRGKRTRLKSLVWLAVIGVVITALVIGYRQLYKPEEDVLDVHVANPLGQPLTGVILSTTGEGSNAAATDGAGKTRLKLASRTKPGDEVTLQVVSAPQDLVFISPWNQRVTLHSFEKSQAATEVVLAERGNRMLLEYPQAALAMVLKINAANSARMGVEPLTEEQRRENLAEAARAFGFNPEEVDRAIRALGEKATDDYQRGLVALYEKNYSEATKHLAASVLEGKRRLEQVKGELADKHRFLGQAFYEQGLYRESASEHQEAVELRPEDDAALNRLGVALLAAAEYVKAEQCLWRRLEIAERTSGEDRPKLAQSLNNLAMVYQAQAKYSEAEPLHVRSLGIWEGHFGPDHTDVANGLNNLGLLYQTIARYDKTESLHKRALAIREKRLRPGHPYIAQSLNNLAFVYQTLAKYDDAKLLHKRALEIWEKEPGSDHPDTARSQNNSGLIYFTQGKYVEAEVLFKRALDIWEKKLGSDHPDVALALNNLAMVYQTLGKYDSAEPLHNRALAIWKARFGPEHPQVAISLDNMGKLYHVQNRYEEAGPLFVQALTIREARLGPEHPYVAESLNNLALVYQAQNRHVEAEPLHRRTLSIWERKFGPEHPDVAKGFNNLGLLYQAQNRHFEAEALFKRASEIWEKKFGPEHPNVAKSLSNLAVTYQSQGKHSEAEQFFRRALMIWEKPPGLEDLSVANALDRYALLLRNTNRGSEARKIESRAKAIRSKIAKNVQKGN